MQLYDTLRREKRDFVPRDGDRVTMYFCGPTVYNLIHLGNARPYVVSIIAKRFFEAYGYRVTLVENITDIDDRIIELAKEQGRTAREVADEFIAAYREDTDQLGMGRPDIEPLATEHIPEIIELIRVLEEKGLAYAANSDVYFDVDRFPEYGKLSGQRTKEMRHGARIAPDENKEDPLDFALWKGAKAGEPAWDSPWGPGRPGWHIECSAMSLKYLGAGFDIHGGGRDLVFPHHENEVAQAEGALGGTFVRFWVHNGMLNLDTEKMSKSVGNIFLLREALKHYAPETVIMYFVGSHYRSPMEFSAELLEEAEQQVARLRNFFRALDAYEEAHRGRGADDGPREGWEHAEGPQSSGEKVELLTEVSRRREHFMHELEDDLNTAGALGEIFALARDVNAALAAGKLPQSIVPRIRERIEAMLHILGLDAVSRLEEEIPAEVLALAEERQNRRRERDFAEADRLRDEILSRGYEVRDGADGFQVVRTG